MKRIGVFIYSLSLGGAERVASNYLKYLKMNTDYEVKLILMKDEILLDDSGVERIYLAKNKSKMSNLAKFIQLFTLASPLKKLCKSEKIDTLVCFLNRPNYIALIAKYFGLKTRVIIHECSTPSAIFRGFSGVANLALIRLLYPLADKILANSVQTCEELQKSIHKDVIYLPNMLDLDHIKKKSCFQVSPFYLKKQARLYEKNKSIKKPGFLPKRFLLNIGRLDCGKNHEMLIKAYKISGVKIPLIIIGDGPLFGYLQDLIKKENLEHRVILRGKKSNVFPFLKRCFALVCSSNYEGCSNVLMEGLACKSLILSTLHPNGVLGLLRTKEGDLGLLGPVGDAPYLAKDIAFACEQMPHDEIKAIQNKGYKQIQKFDMPYIGEKLCELL